MSHFIPFDELSPSTITLLGLFSSELDLFQIFEKIEVLDETTLSPENALPRNKKLKFPLVEEEGVLSVRLTDRKYNENEPPEESDIARCFDGRSSWCCRGIIGNKPFSTDLAIDYSGGGKNFSIKIYSCGKFHITGARSLEESYTLIWHLANDIKATGVPDLEVEWIDPQTINYVCDIGYNISFEKLGPLLQKAGLLPGYDNILSKKIDIVLPSNVSKEHLNSDNPPRTRIHIYDSGKIVLGGPSIEELGEHYLKLTGIIDKHFDEILSRDQKRKKTTAELTAQVLNLFEDSKTILTPNDIKSALDVKEKRRINSALKVLVDREELTRIEAENRSNPRYQLRVDGSPTRRTETAGDSGNRPKVDLEAIVEKLGELKLRARDLAREILGSETKPNITAVNSALSTLLKNERVEKILTKDKEPSYQKL